MVMHLGIYMATVTNSHRALSHDVMSSAREDLNGHVTPCDNPF